MAILNYFKRGMTLVHDSNFSDWLYIIKSGSCNILKKLKNVKPASRLRIAPVEPTHRIRLASLSDTQHELLIERNLRLAELRSQQQSQHMRMATCYELGVAIRPVARPPPVKWSLHYQEHVIQERTNDPWDLLSNQPHADDAANSLKNLTLMRSRAKKARPKASNGKKTVSDEFNVKFLSSDLHRTDADFNPAFVRIQTLTKGCEFGLAHLMHDNQPSFSLVSNGAECILINKKFYLDNVDKHLMNALRMKVCPYPSDDELQSFLQVHVDWQDSRTTVIADSLRRNREKKIDINDARSITQSY
ncbi:hypothetical protein CAPTEDRAFT_189052 [Capitella teleta]|uniref:Cyclic nucleotide-binding domain-containing protein n=1 Tax=Capitella teleta TaxID=283909 RepID=R7UNL2_CAPTE|nr:hypothetical protein CAPTEDRAFT_189052 [Capitella teleta]|eukprot:ELU07683.1 hypothetical protein CAPTEDRAFT_189052 [Capitella teleta]